jgi:hypothetical protein
MATRFASGRVVTLALFGIAFFLWLTAPAKAQSQCVGDCDHNGQVLVNELVTCVNIALDVEALSVCMPCSVNGKTVQINDLITAVNNALDGCPATPTATNTSPVTEATPTATTASTSTATSISTSTATPVNSATGTPTLTPSPTPTSTGCPLGPGEYIQTTAVLCYGGTNNRSTCDPNVDCPDGMCIASVCLNGMNDSLPCDANKQCPGGACEAGALHVATFQPFPFPAGGVTIQEVGPGDANCVHTTVVPFPGGLTVPIFCVPALGATTSVVQSGCGVGEIDSNGGSDFTVNENGDTSFTSMPPAPTCDVHQAGACSPGVCSGIKVGSTCTSGPKMGAMCSGLNATAANAKCGLCTVGTGLTCNTDLDCGCPNSGPPPDSSGHIDITVGDGTVDTCTSGTANAIVTIPVNTLTWVAASRCSGGTHDGTVCAVSADCKGCTGNTTACSCTGGTNDGTACTSDAQCTGGGTCGGTCTGGCPDPDKTYNAGTDTLLASFPQTLDLTTDKATAQFVDIDGDGCKKSGLGPNGPYSSTGQCIDLTSNTVTVAASGTIFSSGGPTYDLLFTTIQNSTVSGPGPLQAASCDQPPVINFTGTANRCLVGP